MIATHPYSCSQFCNKLSQQEYIAHHGILGQKWGKRNGPPYPLNAENHSVSEKKAGWKKSLNKGGKKEGKHLLNDKQKKILRNAGIGTGITAAALGAIYVAEKKFFGLKSEDLSNNFVMKGRSIFQRTMASKSSQPAFTAADRDLIELLSEIVNIIDAVER